MSIVNYSTFIVSDKQVQRGIMALQEFAWRVTASNLGKAVEIKPVIVVKFKLIMIPLSYLK